MLKQILDAYRTHRVMVAVEEEIRKIFKISRELFSASSGALLECKEVGFDLYARDREINLTVVGIRKKIVEHLAVTSSENVSGELVFLKIVNDLERIGDYSKNIMDLHKMMESCLVDNPYIQRFQDVYRNIDTFFDKAENALFDGPETEAYAVIQGHRSVNWTCEKILEELMEDEDLKAPVGIALALTARYYKRVSSHLKNVASTAVNPYSHIGYMKTPEIDPDNHD
jgi:phosphate uptake regulator